LAPGPSQNALLSETKRCYDCGLVKPIAEFAFQSVALATRQSRCRLCHAVYRRGHYLRNRADYVRREVARIRRYRNENRVALLEYLTAHPCVDCGEPDPVVLQFDHRDRGSKVGYIAHLLVRKPWSTVLREIEKCDVVCANCHRLRTARQFSWRKLPASSLLTVAEKTDGGSAEETKRCSRCRMDKPLSEFVYRDRARGRRRSWCRSCMASYQHDHYLRNRGSSKARPRRNDRKALRAGVEAYLREHPCVDCGETNPLLLDFDHRDGTVKLETVGWLLARGHVAQVWEEIAKCDTRCSNCHYRRTARQFGWLKLLHSVGYNRQNAGVL
jgi:hypothetical protein